LKSYAYLFSQKEKGSKPYPKVKFRTAFCGFYENLWEIVEKYDIVITEDVM